jgi:hypothetical protein
MKIPVLALTATLLSASALFAQTADKPPLLENDQIRVRELRFAPGSARRSEAKPNTFLYALTDGALVFTPPGRKGYELSFKAGEALWLPSQETATANEGDKEVRILAVEVKAKPPVAKKGRGKGKKGGKKGAAKG